MKALINRLAALFLLFAFCGMLTGCAQTTATRASTFTDPGFHGPAFDSMIVDSRTDSLSERQAIENAAVEDLRRAGVSARPSMEIFPPTHPATGEMIRRRIMMNTGAAGVLEIHTAARWTDREYFPGSHFHGSTHAFDHGYFYEPGFYDPGYVVEEPHVRYDVTLYTLPGYKAAWTGQFDTRGPGGMSFDEVGAHFADQLVKHLAEDGMIMIQADPLTLG